MSSEPISLEGGAGTEAGPYRVAGDDVGRACRKPDRAGAASGSAAAGRNPGAPTLGESCGGVDRVCKDPAI